MIGKTAFTAIPKSPKNIIYMKTLLKVICCIAFMFVLGSCRKEVNEPTTIKDGDEYIFIEIEGDKFLVENRKWIFNRNTKGDINDQYSFVADKIHYSNEFQNTKLIKGQCSGSIDIAFDKSLGTNLPQFIRLSLRLDKDGQKPIYQIRSDYENSGSTNTIKDFQLTLVNFDDEKKNIEYQFNGTVLNIQDSLFYKIKIKSKTIFK